MRLFIAIGCGELKDYFLQMQNAIGKGHAKINYTHSYHLTLKFLGDVMDTNVENIKKLLGEIKFKPFSISFSKIGYFTPKKIRVVWAGLDDNRKVITLQSQVDNALRNYYLKEERFHPHVTLGRVKVVNDMIGLKCLLDSVKVEKKELFVGSFKLIRSTLKPDGPVYEDIAVFS